MRYKLNEDVVLASNLPEGNSVTISVLDLANDTVVIVSNDVCTESSIVAGLYTWSTSNIASVPQVYKNYYYEMTDGTNKVAGKFVYGGYVDAIGTVQEVVDGVWTKELG